MNNTNTIYTNGNQNREFFDSKALYENLMSGKLPFFGIELKRDRADRKTLNVIGDEEKDILNSRVEFVVGDGINRVEGGFGGISEFSLAMKLKERIFAAKVKLEGHNEEIYFSSGDKSKLFHCWFDIEPDEDQEEGVNIYCSNALIGTYTGIVLAHDGCMDEDIESQGFYDAMTVAMENSVKR